MANMFFLSRELWDNPDFRDGEMTQREAFIWMIAHAVWKPQTVRLGSESISLDRGQLAYSLRFLAYKWGWSKSRVSRYLDVLKNRDTIETITGTGFTVITVCNYDKYQWVGEGGGTPAKKNRDSSGTPPGQRRKPDKTGEFQEDNKGASDDTPAEDLFGDDDPEAIEPEADRFEEAYQLYRSSPLKANQTKKDAKSAWPKAVERAGSQQRIIDAIQVEVDRRIAAHQTKEFMPNLRDMHRWLKSESWNDVEDSQAEAGVSNADVDPEDMAEAVERAEAKRAETERKKLDWLFGVLAQYGDWHGENKGYPVDPRAPGADYPAELYMAHGIRKKGRAS